MCNKNGQEVQGAEEELEAERQAEGEPEAKGEAKELHYRLRTLTYGKLTAEPCHRSSRQRTLGSGWTV